MVLLDVPNRCKKIAGLTLLGVAYLDEAEQVVWENPALLPFLLGSYDLLTLITAHTAKVTTSVEFDF